MKDSSYRVLRFVLVVASTLTLFSFLQINSADKVTAFSNVNLLQDIFIPASMVDSLKGTKDVLSVSLPKAADTAKVERNQQFYHTPFLITDFATTAGSALPIFSQKLTDLKRGKKTKVRIAYLGDSMIEGDRISQTLRDLLQHEYGGVGVGYLPMSATVGNFRLTASIHGAGWHDVSFKTEGSRDHYLSGHFFTGSGNGHYIDRSVEKGSEAITEKAILYGAAPEPWFIDINGVQVVLSGDKLVNRTVIGLDSTKSIAIDGAAKGSLFGVSFESPVGVILDNFSFRGISGSEFRKLSDDFLSAIDQANHYDLVILHYGPNLIYGPNDRSFGFYQRAMDPVLKKLKKCFPTTDFLLISSGDIAFRYNGIYQTAVGMDNLLETQAKLAYENHLAFFNLYESMGGRNAMVNWVQRNPPYGRKDYMHPTELGSEVIGKILFNALQKDSDKVFNDNK